jgi:hypothetical protein
MTIGPLFQGVGSTVYFFAGDFGGDFGLWKTPGDTGEVITPLTDNSLWVFQLGISK